MLASIPLYWWLMALGGLAIVVGVGVGLWRTKTIKLLRAIRLENRGIRVLWAGYSGRAEKLLLRSLRLAEAADGPDGPEVGPIVANLAQVYEWQEKFDEAERLYRRAIAIRENAVGETDPFLVVVLGNLAHMLHSRGRQDEAAALEERAQVIQEANPPDENALKSGRRGTVTSAGLIFEPPGWRELMESAAAAEDDGEAEEHLMAALALAEWEGPASPHLGETLHEFGSFLFWRERLDEAAAHLQRAVLVREAAFGSEHAGVATSLNNLAEVYRAQRREAEALPLLERALAITEASDQPDQNELATSLNNLASLYEHLGRLDDAEGHYRRALESDEALLGPDHPNLTTILRNLANLYWTQGRYANAEPLAERAVSISERDSASAPHAVAKGLHLLALIRFSEGRYGDAVPDFARALNLLETGHDLDDPQLIIPLLNYASALWKEGHDGETKAEELIKRSLCIAERHFGSDHPEVARSLDDLSELYAHQGRGEEVEQLRGRAQAIGRIH